MRHYSRFSIKATPAGKSVWTTKGETISEKNAMSLYSLTLDDLHNAFNEKKLQIQHRSFHGNSYRVYVKNELELLCCSLAAGRQAIQVSSGIPWATYRTYGT